MKNDEVIIAIDPGNLESAYVVYSVDKINEFGKVYNNDLLNLFKHLNTDYNVRAFGIEMIASYGMPVGVEVFETCLWIGRFTQQWLSVSGKKPDLIYRREVKLHLCNSSKAKDSNIRQGLVDRYGNPGTKKHPGFTYGVTKDVWSALAVATYIYETMRYEKGS